jgi:formate hydrogenlyase subunit 6/NADH:ubiquinone oxidoreductase subunit I
VAAVGPEADCTGCLQCATICPDAAIEVRRAKTAVRSAGARSDASGHK